MVDARGNTVTHGFILVPAAGRTSSKGVCKCTVLFCTGVLVVGGTSETREGEAPKSLLDD